jgi:hypothetical protein
MCRVTLSSQDISLDDPQTEPYYSIQYEVRPLRQETLEVPPIFHAIVLWPESREKCMQRCGHPLLNDAFRVPEPNLFITTNFELLVGPACFGTSRHP